MTKRIALVCLLYLVSCFTSSQTTAADHIENKNLGGKAPGDAASATVSPPGEVTSGQVDINGNWPWGGGPASFNATVPMDYAGNHRSKFSGEYVPVGEGPERTFTWEMNVTDNAVDFEIVVVFSDYDRRPNRNRAGIRETGTVRIVAKSGVNINDVLPLRGLKISSGDKFLELKDINLGAGTSAFEATYDAGMATIEAEDKNGNTRTYEIAIIKPTGVKLERAPNYDVLHIKGTPSVGFVGLVYITPFDVSFKALKIIEEDCVAKGTGIFKNTAYSHNPNQNPMPCEAFIEGKGTMVKPFDIVRIAINGWTDGDVGTLTFNIKCCYIDAHGGRQHFATVVQFFKLWVGGRMDACKGMDAKKWDVKVPAELEDATNWL